jgi:NitT/TauT family transport system ATP-binding protein
MALYADNKFASIFVTHSVDEAVFLATRVLVMCSRPGTVVAEFSVPFDYPRDPALRYEAEFTKIAGSVAEALRAAS